MDLLLIFKVRHFSAIVRCKSVTVLTKTPTGAIEEEQRTTFVRCIGCSCNLLQYQPPLVTVDRGRLSEVGTQDQIEQQECAHTRMHVVWKVTPPTSSSLFFLFSLPPHHVNSAYCQRI